jgi:Xaa-Pro aminopeptidase
MNADHPSLKTSSHDLPLTERLAEFMRTGWAAPGGAGPGQAAAAPFHARRRAALAALFPGETLVVPSGQLRPRANDTDFEFRPGTEFAYLTGEYEPDSVLVIAPDGQATVYRRPGSARDTDEFFMSRDGELWVGRRWTLAESEAALGVACARLEELEKVLAGADPATTRALRGYDSAVDGAVVADGEGLRDGELGAALSELRLVKDSWEIAQLEDAVAATVRGFEDVVRALPADRDSSERLVDGVFGLRARHDGNLTGYGTIAAAGPNACTLHWWRNDGVCRPGELLLLDAGVENRHYYTADITRTLPISGEFTGVQRRVYDLVLAGQQAGIEAVRPGALWRDIHRACMRVIAAGLQEWGLLPIPAEESLRDDVGLHRRWTLHASGHMLGLDVHDCARARAETYLDGELRAGMVLTVEPGLYFQPDDETVPAELRGIGIRIEDDVLVTDDGCRILSDALPREAREVEQWMAAQRAAGPRLPS